MKKSPAPNAASLGTLPRESVVESLEKEKGPYLNVQVDLEEGLVQGWLEKAFLKVIPDQDQEGDQKVEKSSSISVDDSENSAFVDKPSKKKKDVKKKRAIPDDEKLLLGRERSFYYGLIGGINLSLLYPSVYGSFFTGGGPVIGADFAYYFWKNWPFRFMLDYETTTAFYSTTQISVGFFEVAVLPTYETGAFEFSAGLGVKLGLGIQALPSAITYNTPVDMSHPELLLGMGWKIPVTSQTQMTLRGQYSLSLSFSPVFYQMFKILAAFEIWG